MSDWLLESAIAEYGFSAGTGTRLSLLVFTDMGARARGHRHVGPRAYAILAALGLAAQPVFAQEAVTVPGGLRVRKVVLVRTQAGRPATTVYGVVGRPLLVLFDAPLGKAPVRAPGVEIDRHPLRPNALVVTPSRALAASRGPVSIVVPLPGGAITLSLVIKPDAPDARVDIARSPDSSRGAQSKQAELEHPGTPRHVVTPCGTPTLKVIVSN